ncbi:hypothetical protein LW347_19625 [Pectobacterium polonicum]|uniref:Uncharacterized protein n=1 Tax=Pectobacterium polonicum TaxID=2485124 RepID=A0AAE9T2A7_9GAMM|nr:hypothetical protein [Pectobacterium polonicum]MDC9821430.1 hypothetical protein [Pectobacterium polonicum]UVO08019.1 hypothetical protein LW347_19625 [Pectobacterium polonicum]GKW25648.1 hypothetical protein PEC311524_32420 [Pectobacterium carotovorum subsp. carotovorum]
MLKSPTLLVLSPFILSFVLFSSKAISSDDKPLPIDLINGKVNFIQTQNQNICIVKNKKSNEIIVEEKYSRTLTDRCIAECSYLLDMPGDYGSTNFHSCLAQCKGGVAMCDF